MRLEELLADRALVGLERHESDELGALLADARLDDPTAHELVAAAVDLALGPVRFEPLPAALRSRVLADAEELLGPSARAAAMPPTGSHPSPARPSPAWWVALAAAALALIGWWPRLSSTGAPAAGAERAALLASADALRLDWSATDLAIGATGDVVWSQARQRGYLRIAGLPVNDPATSQYQLWIFDDERAHPVDGGVFDAAPGEILVPIDAKLDVAAPTLFAVTIEKPGGVVVSDRERIALLAPI
jgi:anti-sigma-K factor RskA